MLKLRNLQGVHVIGTEEIGLLKGDGTVAVFDKNGMIYKFLTLDSWTLNKRDMDDP